MNTTVKSFWAVAAATLAVSAIRADNLEVDGGQYVEVVDDPATVGEVRLGTTQNNPDRAVLVLKPTGTFTFTDRFRVGYETGTYGSVTQECGTTVRIGKGGMNQNSIGYAHGSDEWSEYVILPGAFLDGWVGLDGQDRGFDIGIHGKGRMIVDGGMYKSYLDFRLGVENDGQGELIIKNGGTFELHNNGNYWPNPMIVGRNADGCSVTVTGTGSTLTVSEFVELRHNSRLVIEDGGLVTVPFVYGSNTPGSIYANGGTLAYDNRTPKTTSGDFADKAAAKNGYLIDGVAALYVGEDGFTVDIPDGLTIKLNQKMLKDPAISAGNTCGDFVKTGGGTLVLEDENTFDGRTVIKGGILVLPSTDAIDMSKLVIDGGTFALPMDTSRTIGADEITALVTALVASGGTTLAFDINAGVVITVDAAMSLPDGIGVAKSGEGTLVLNGANSWTGETVLAGGILIAVPGQGVPSASHILMLGGTWAGSGRLALGIGSGAGQVSFGPNGCNFAAVGDDLELVFNPDETGAPVDVDNSNFNGDLYFNYAAGDHTLKLMNRITSGPRNVYCNYATVDFVGGNDTGSDMVLRGTGKVVLSGPTHVWYALIWDNSIDLVITNQFTEVFGRLVNRSSGTSSLYPCTGNYYFNEIEIANNDHSGAYVSTTVVEEGADFRVNNWYHVGRKERSTGILRINGGSMTNVKTDQYNHIGYDQNFSTGIVEVVSGAITNGSPVYVGGHGYSWNNHIIGILRLYGGEFVAPQISACLDADRVDSQEYIDSSIFFDGGRMVISQDQPELFKFVDTITTGANGGVIDTAGHDVKIVADASCYSSTGILSKVGEGELELDWIPFGEGGFEVGGGTVRVPSGTIPAAVPETDGGEVPVQTLYFADGGKLVCDGDLDLSNVVLAFRDHAVPVNYFASHTPRRWTLVETTGTLTVGSSTIPRGTSTHGYSYYVTEHAVMVDRPSGLAIIVR